jgi:hypothetical protein
MQGPCPRTLKIPPAHLEIKGQERYTMGEENTMIPNAIQKYVRSLLLPGLLSLLPGCPIFQAVYHVHYDGNGHTGGSVPVDFKTYAAGDQAVILEEKPEKGSLTFLGWQQPGSDIPLQAGDRILINDDVFLYAWWENDPDANPFETRPDASGGIIITNYIRYAYGSSSVIIPETLEGKPVTGIGEAAFADLFLDTITLPPRLEFIGNKAFVGNRLTRLIIPDSVKSIGKLAFQKVSLETLSLGSGLELIDMYAFDDNQLQNLFLPPRLKEIGEGAFADNPLESIEIGEAVVIHGDTALGIYGAAFRTCYAEKGSKAGVYLYKTDHWEGPYQQ